jgi:hypothetical protein
MLAGIVSLPRMIDKTRANAEGTLGEYDVDCPHDRPVLDFLGVDFATFAAQLKDLHYDDAAVEGWAKTQLAGKAPAEVAAFNESRRNWGPDEHSRPYFEDLRAKVAPNRSDVKTWFELLDLDEGRQPARTGR